MRVVEHGDSARYLGRHLGKDVEVAIPKGVVQQQAIPLCACGRIAHDVNDGDVFGVCTGESIDSRELAHSKSGDDGGDAFYACVAIGGIAWKMSGGCT